MGDVLLRRPRITVGQPLDPLAAAGTTTDTGVNAPDISTPPSSKYPSPRLPRPSRRDFIKRCGTTAPLPGLGYDGYSAHCQSAGTSGCTTTFRGVVELRIRHRMHRGVDQGERSQRGAVDPGDLEPGPQRDHHGLHMNSIHLVQRI